MEIIKILKDYSKNPLEEELSEYFFQELESVICHEKIKNKKFLIEYFKPVNDFAIYTNAYPGAASRRML